jgi:hypothetical protein
VNVYAGIFFILNSSCFMVRPSKFSINYFYTSASENLFVQKLWRRKMSIDTNTGRLMVAVAFYFQEAKCKICT